MNASTRGDNSTTQLRKEYIDSHKQSRPDSRQFFGKRSLKDVPDLQRRGPVVPASDNPRYSIAQERNTLLAASSGYDTDDYVREPDVGTLKSDIRPDQGPCKTPNQTTLVLPCGYTVPRPGCKIHWQSVDAAFSKTTDGKMGANPSTIYAFTPEWPCSETVKVSVEGLRVSGRDAQILEAGCFTFTPNMTRKLLGHGSQCPTSSSSGEHVAQEKLYQILQVLGCRCEPRVTGHGIEHSATCPLVKVARDGQQVKEEKTTVEIQNCLKVLSQLESVVAGQVTDDADGLDSTAVVESYLTVPVAPLDKHLSYNDACCAYDDPNTTRPTITGLVAPKQVRIPGEKFAVILEEIRDRRITLERGLEKGRDYTYLTTPIAGVTVPDPADTSKQGDVTAGAKIPKGAKHKTKPKKKQSPPKDTISTSSSENASISGKVRPPQPPPKPKSKKPPMSYKEPDTDESTTYAAGSLSSFTSQDSAEQPYGTRDVQNLKKALSDDNILASSNKEQRMESRQSSSPCPVVHTLTNWKHGSALPMTDPAAEEPIYMNTGQLGMNKTKHQNAGRLNRYSTSVTADKVIDHNG
jgi:hypothetical protein